MNRYIVTAIRSLPSQHLWLILQLLLLMYNCFHFTPVEAKVIEGELMTDKNWVFLTRFCFLSREGIFEYNVSYPQNYAPQNLLLYFDAKSQWPAVYKQNKTCQEKQMVLIDDFNQVINLTEYQHEYRATTASGCKLDPVPDEYNQTWYRCVHHRTFQSYRERWWFIAVDNCNTDKGLWLRYRITMTNSQTNPWLRHFSADQFYILHTDVIMCVLFYLLLMATCFEAYALYTRHLFHKTYKLYIASLMAECIGLLFLCTYYGIYAQSGYANEFFRLVGKGFEAASTLIFLLLLLLLSKGYTITRARLKPRTVTKFTVFMVASTIAYAIIFYHEQYAFDPGEVLYIYESFFGYLLVSLRLLAWTWFSYAIVFTLIHYPQKSAFFAKLFLVYSIWFVSAPIVIMVATFVIPKWMREKIINAVELAIAFKAHLIFFFLTRPSRANKNFPFHVRTTQIAIMEKAGGVDSGSLEHFSNYKYAPSKMAPISIFALTHQNNGIDNGVVTLNNGVAASLPLNGRILNGNANNVVNNNSNNPSSALINNTNNNQRYKILNTNVNSGLQQFANSQQRTAGTSSVESELTSVTSLSNSSHITHQTTLTPPGTSPSNQDTTQLPQAEE